MNSPNAIRATRPHRTRLRLPGTIVAGGLGLAFLPPHASAAIVHNAASDFSASSNPNGVWSFGSEYPTLGSPFILKSYNGSTYGLDYWADNPGPILPAAFHNPTGSTIYYGTSVEVDAGQLILHPEELGQYSIARFTAPIAATYTFSADFIGQDYVTGTLTDVYLLVNNAVVWSSDITGFHNIQSSGTFVMSLNPLDTIDAAVGFGANGNYYGDSTGLDFTVSYIPAPGSMALLGFGGLVASRRWRA